MNLAGEKEIFSKDFLSEIESGKRPVSLKVIRKYATVFSVPASSLLFFMEVVGDTRDEAVPVKGLLQTATLKMLYWIREQFDDEQDCE